MHSNRKIPESLKNLLTRHTFNIQRFTHYRQEGASWTFINADCRTAVMVERAMGGDTLQVLSLSKEAYEMFLEDSIYI